MKIHRATALVTGANRGLGRQFVRELLTRGASVYATARETTSLFEITGDKVTVLPLDVTDPSSVAASAETASDVDLLINNAGVFTRTGQFEVVADKAAASDKSALSKTPEERYPELANAFRR
ncbi:SDR family NAD(P)-dependent oxidoreductase [Spiractinospora alimapuensis]|uniref:SDR family NAD(P)-dependent oxidoreductase n=1 Tax=Spiractinospora alimapuensis TaxID=2820884 RepID=UPI001F33251C|nr:SDR family NAD(P)-dependent oxidoreductase [Spiractinospora alimapuensis]QVQ53412.1 SDR family NAD(P)-dependent oxidoreductase [Spiractinospora alimapuensis]